MVKIDLEKRTRIQTLLTAQSQFQALIIPYLSFLGRLNSGEPSSDVNNLAKLLKAISNNFWHFIISWAISISIYILSKKCRKSIEMVHKRL
jgi:hypothetical protein